MNESSNVFDALALVPGWDPGEAEIEELKGGLTNSTYRVKYYGEYYALRLDVEESEVLRFDRKYELSIVRAAHEAGIGPEVVHVDSEAGVMLTRFLPGRVWEEKDLESDDQLVRLAATLRAVHALPTCGKRVNYVEEASRYETFLERRQGLHAFASRCVEIVRETQDRGVVACCHNDIIVRNIIDNGELRFIDWEYARDNDPMYDLAGVIGFHDLDEQKAGVLLDAYAGGASAELKERLDEQCRAYDAIQWLWFATRQIAYPDPAQVRRLEALQQRIS